MKTADTGWLQGHPIRKARKEYRCDCRACRKQIAVGDEYVQGDIDPDRAGGFGHQRICTDCARLSRYG
jgi:hypothetical protein